MKPDAQPPKPRRAAGGRRHAPAAAGALPDAPAAPEAFDPELWPIAWMARAERQHARNSSALLKPLGLQHREFRLLAFLGRNPGVCVGRLAEVSVLERTTLSKMLDRLEAQGLVQRGASEADRRRAPLALTPAGCELLQAATPLVEGLFHAYRAHMDAVEHRRFVAALRRFFEGVCAAAPDSADSADAPDAQDAAGPAAPRR